MAEGKITAKDLWDAFEAGSLVYSPTEVWSSERIRNAFDEWLGEDRIDLIDPGFNAEEDGEEVIEDLDLVYKLLDTCRQELLDAAHGGNLERRHHLEDAVSCFEDIGTLFKAERILRQTLDIREEVDNGEEDDTAGVPEVDPGDDGGQE